MQTHEKKKKWDELLIDFYDRCRKAGLKITPQRLTVYKALVRTDTHPTADEVYLEVRKEMPNISLDTVNRTLLTLAQIGAAFVVEGTGQPRRYDGGLESHQHFRCLRCGRIIDFHHEPYDTIETPAPVAHLRILRKTVYFEGYCQNCDHDN